MYVSTARGIDTLTQRVAELVGAAPPSIRPTDSATPPPHEAPTSASALMSAGVDESDGARHQLDLALRQVLLNARLSLPLAQLAHGGRPY